ncbi:hypothetical protein TL16_g09945 [Triparma laevis f. inornata]|uniref:HhH-GPD domain-containing protein n=1 Tax=Triparma laevis f. inornata TaxID=1714386 RepID=A0A9W7EKT3_9STRA|nr:hypothetical protein TL16_g09945 [Triparma laevis f. inornata]
MKSSKEDVEGLIRVAGLATTRTERIFALLETLSAEQKSDAPSLEYLRDMSNDEVKKELGRFKGLGPKTISCVMLFGMARDEFPVDTHVLRIAKLQRWVGSGATRESAYDALNVAVPDALKMDLHCLLVKHGKVCHRCAANNKPQFPPADGVPLVCPLAVNKVVGGVKKEVVSLMVKVEKEGDGKRAKASGKVKKEEQ